MLYVFYPESNLADTLQFRENYHEKNSLRITFNY